MIRRPQSSCGTVRISSTRLEPHLWYLSNRWTMNLETYIPMLMFAFVYLPFLVYVTKLVEFSRPANVVLSVGHETMQHRRLS